MVGQVGSIAKEATLFAIGATRVQSEFKGEVFPDCGIYSPSNKNRKGRICRIDRLHGPGS